MDSSGNGRPEEETKHVHCRKLNKRNSCPSSVPWPPCVVDTGGHPQKVAPRSWFCWRLSPPEDGAVKDPLQQIHGETRACLGLWPGSGRRICWWPILDTLQNNGLLATRYSHGKRLKHKTIQGSPSIGYHPYLFTIKFVMNSILIGKYAISLKTWIKRGLGVLTLFPWIRSGFQHAALLGYHAYLLDVGARSFLQFLNSWFL